MSRLLKWCSHIITKKISHARADSVAEWIHVNSAKYNRTERPIACQYTRLIIFWMSLARQRAAANPHNYFAACHVLLSIVLVCTTQCDTESKAQLYDPSWNTDQGVQLDCESSSIFIYSVDVSIDTRTRRIRKWYSIYYSLCVNWCYHACSATQADYVYALEFISGVYDYI